MKVSPMMNRLIEYMKQHDDSVCRFAGGYWAHEGWKGAGVSFGTSTVEAVVSRGLAEYTEYVDGRRGRFPVRVKRIAPPKGDAK